MPGEPLPHSSPFTPYLTLHPLPHWTEPIVPHRESLAQCKIVNEHGPLLVYDSTLGRGAAGIPPDIASLNAYWSKYYRSNSRNPSEVQQLAPWVERKFRLSSTY